MNDLAKDMSDDDLRKFSEYFSKLAPPKASGEAADPQIAARAQGVIATNHCASCHNPDFSGREQMPRLAAQREDYLLKALRDYKSAKRPGYDATMDEVIGPSPRPTSWTCPLSGAAEVKQNRVMRPRCGSRGIARAPTAR